MELIEDFFKRDIAGNLKVQKNASISTRIKRKLIQNPLISISFATTISFLGTLFPGWLGGILGGVFLALTVYLYTKD